MPKILTQTGVSVLLLLFSAQLSFAQQAPKLSVKVDPRFESISIFYFLATLDTVDIKPTPSIYLKDVEIHFAGFRDHASIKWYRNLETWDGFDLPSLGYYLSESAPFKIKKIYNAHYLRSSAKAQFLQALNTFSKDFNTKAFMAKSKKLHSKVTKKVEDDIMETGILTSLRDFYGNNDMKEVVLHLDLLNNQGNNAITTKGDQLTMHLAYLNPKNSSLTNDSAVNFIIHENIIAHEASHTYLKSFSAQYQQQLEQIKSLFLTTTKGEQLKESQWQNEFEELFVRTCVAKILEQKYGTEKGKAEIDNQAKHFKLATSFHAMMNQYTNNRSKYPNLKAFYPEIMRYFVEMARLNTNSRLLSD